jgi:hypothetical protein
MIYDIGSSRAEQQANIILAELYNQSLEMIALS